MRCRSDGELWVGANKNIQVSLSLRESYAKTQPTRNIASVSAGANATACRLFFIPFVNDCENIKHDQPLKRERKKKKITPLD